MKLILDAGHYGRYNQSPVVAGYYESEMTWKLHKLLLGELIAYEDIAVGTTRSDQEYDMEVYDRGRKAKGYDLFLSLHSNACGRESTDYPLAILPYGASETVRSFGEALACRAAAVMETREGGRTWVRTYQQAGKTLDYYGVLRGARSAGVESCFILECGFHTNKRSAEWLLDESNLKKLAAGLAEEITGHYGLKKREETEEMTEAEVKKLVAAERESLLSEVTRTITKAIGEASSETRYKWFIQLPDSYRPTIEKLYQKGLIKGVSPSDLDLPEATVKTLVVLDRAGLFD